jgi:hypothetical protein
MRQPARCIRRGLAAVVLVPCAVVQAQRPGPTAPKVIAVTVNPADVTSGSGSRGVALLDSAASAPVFVNLSSSRPSVASVPSAASTTMSAPREAQFAVSTQSPGCATIEARAGEGSPQRTLLAVHPVARPGSPLSLALSAPAVPGGKPVVLQVTYTGQLVGAGGTGVTLRSDRPDVAPVPAAATVPPGGVLRLEVRTQPVQSVTCVLLGAGLGATADGGAVLLRVTP